MSPNTRKKMIVTNFQLSISSNTYDYKEDSHKSINC